MRYRRYRVRRAGPGVVDVVSYGFTARFLGFMAKAVAYYLLIGLVVAGAILGWRLANQVWILTVVLGLVVFPMVVIGVRRNAQLKARAAVPGPLSSDPQRSIR